uniref:Sushi domain-containing protein n=3 Tax=Lygus hesperus TaxID=30085 RepID=A0A0K8SJY0_LYGHE
MTLLDARQLLLVLTCAAVNGRDDWHPPHRLGLRPRVDLKNPSLDEDDPHNLLDLQTPTKQIYHNHLDPLYVGTYPSRLYSFDDVEFNRRCLPCPEDVKIVAKRKSLTAAFTPPEISSSSCPDLSGGNVVVHINRGPIQGEQLGPGLYHIFITIIHYGTSAPHRAAQCHYTYEVIVNRCSPHNLADGRIKAVCSHENAWGSNCTFTCPSGYLRQGFARTRCKNDLSWSHGVPRCRLKRRGPCKLTAFGGVFECTNGEDLELNEYVSSGTVCRLRCEAGSYIPRRQKHLANIRCFRGRWNSTADPVCIPKPTAPKEITRKVNKPRYGYTKRKYRKAGSTLRP